MFDEIGGIGEKGAGGLELKDGSWNCWNWKLKEKFLTQKVSVIPMTKPQPNTRIWPKKLKRHNWALKYDEDVIPISWSFLLFFMVTGHKRLLKTKLRRRWNLVKNLYSKNK
jgi:hypothetical protein